MDSPTSAPPIKSLLLATQAPTGGQETLQATLVDAGFSVQSTDFEQALHLVQVAPPDLLLIDGCHCSREALALCRRLRESFAPHATPIVILHEDASAEWIGEACEAGVTEVLESCLHPTLLERRLDGAIAYVARLLNDTLLDTDAVRPFDSTGNITAPAVFQRLVSVAIDHRRSSDDVVCVLAIRCNAALTQQHPIPDTFAKQLTRAVREFEQQGLISHPKGSIVVSRLDQSGFALLLPELGHIQDAARLGYKIRECLLRDSVGQPDSIQIGIANSPGDSNEGQELIQLAQKAATILGPNEGSDLNFHTASTTRWVFERLTLEGSLRNSIERNELVVHYQPKVDITSLELIGFEALVRWQHPELGMVSPAQFIPLAEETGLIVEIGEWVLETACRQVKQWEASGLQPVRMAVNLSPVQFNKSSLCETVSDVLQRTDLAPEFLELEVTESMLMHDLTDTINTLQRLKASGIYLSIDDFGTGYSSLSYLKGFPIDALKIDRSFIRDITSKSDDAAIATSIILMGKSLNLHVIAEGVETERQRAFLEVLQCNEMQGYLFSPPVPADKAEAFMTRLK